MIETIKRSVRLEQPILDQMYASYDRSRHTATVTVVYNEADGFVMRIEHYNEAAARSAANYMFNKMHDLLLKDARRKKRQAKQKWKKA